MEVKQLSLKNHQEVCGLFSEDERNYRFVLNDLLTNNYTGKEFKAFGAYDERKMTAILILNEGNLFYYEEKDQPVDCLVPLLKDMSFHKISGPSEMVAKLLPLVNVAHDSLSHMGAVHHVQASRRYPNLQIKQIQSEEEFGMQYDLFHLTEEFKGSLPENKQEYIDSGVMNLKEISNRGYFLAVDGKMAACAATVNEAATSAIIIGVFTNPELRGKGYGTEVLTALFEELLSEGKIPYLFYSNPAARSVYKKLGMTEVCEWRVVYT